MDERSADIGSGMNPDSIGAVLPVRALHALRPCSLRGPGSPRGPRAIPATVWLWVRWPGREGYHIEDVVVIREDGPELVATCMDTSELMEL